MSNNLYLQVFTEAAHSASIVPFASQAAFYAMKLFGGYNMPLACVLAVLGGTLGHLFNWWLGRLVRKNPISNLAVLQEDRYQLFKDRFNKYGLFLLLLAWAPLCNFAVVAAGYLEVPLKIAVPLIILGLTGYYGMALL